jgi:formate dehydrogenase beta subunit
MLNLPVFSDVDPAVQHHLAGRERVFGFGEVLAGLREPEARHEAQRCLSCGNCFECDNCYAACPEQAITKLGPGDGYSVDDAKCTGCGTCFEQCPCHAIEMVPNVS